MTQNFKLHPQLVKDTHQIFDLEFFKLLLHKNSTIPWIIIVPKTHKTEVFELPEPTLIQLNNIIKIIANFLKSEFQSEKINTAAIGNVVPQLHIHVIGRKPSDPCWPDVVWGATYPTNDYTTNTLKKINTHFKKCLKINT